MTPRAIILGLLSAAAVCGFCYFNDFVMRQTFLVGNYMPISVYGGLLVFIIFVNPILLKMSKRLALSGRELSVIVMLTLAACYVPGRGLCHYFTTAMVMPRHFERTNPGWKQHGIVEMAPPIMLAAAPPQYRPDDVKDPLAFYTRLTTEGPKPAPSPSRTVWQRLSDDARATARQALEAARACIEEMESRYMEQGYPPYRVGINSMHQVVKADDPFWQTVRDLKQALDPNHIIAPGRYNLV